MFLDFATTIRFIIIKINPIVAKILIGINIFSFGTNFKIKKMDNPIIKAITTMNKICSKQKSSN